MRSRYYARDGSPITLDEWVTLSGKAEDIRRVARDVLPSGLVVSTVWLGLDHAYDGGPPLIFETMVFSSESEFAELDMLRYQSEAEAIAGHAAMVQRWAQSDE